MGFINQGYFRRSTLLSQPSFLNVVMGGQLSKAGGVTSLASRGEVPERCSGGLWRLEMTSGCQVEREQVQLDAGRGRVWLLDGATIVLYHV